MGIQPVHHITNLQTMCPVNFRVWLPFDHNNIGHNHQQNFTAPEQIYPACPAFTKYIGVKLLHDASGLPYVKDRLLSCATRTLERISKNPSVEKSITFIRVNPAWNRFPTPLSVISPVSLQIIMTYRGSFSERPIAPETGSPAYTRTRLAQSSDLESTSQHRLVCLS